MNDNLTHFLTALSAYKGENVFNPWRDTDADYEVGHAVSIRQEQLQTTSRGASGGQRSFSSPKPAAIRADTSPASP